MSGILDHPTFKKLLPLLLVLAAGFGIGIAVTDEDGDGKRDKVTITIGAQEVAKGADPVGDDGKTEIGDPTKPVSAPIVVDTDHSSDDEPQAAENPGAHEDAGDEIPDDVPADQVEAGLQQMTAPGQTEPQETGGAQNYTCLYKPVVNQSSRNGQAPLIAVLHYTVSANRPGWGDVYAIWGLFNTRSFFASSTYIIDFEGHCLRLMSEKAKPWTNGNLNGRSITVEIVATGRETKQEWLNSPLFKQHILSSLWRDVMRRNGIPLLHVNPAGCTVQHAGWTDHNSLECGNNHTDVQPNFPFAAFQKQLTGKTCGKKCQARKRTVKKLKARHKKLHNEARRKGVEL